MNFSADTLDSLWIMAVAAMTAAACALVGCYLVLRRMSLLGDALSHAVLPGLVIAFLAGGRLNIATMLAGALAVGLATTLLVQLLERQFDVSADAGMGVVFTGMFALGVVLIDRYADAIDLDPDCVLFGLLEFVPLNTVVWNGWEIPRAALSVAPVLLLDVVCVLLFWKELKLASFDPALSTALGFSSGLLHYLLMTLVASTTVAAFEAVGSIVVLAMLVAPPAAANLLTDRLPRMVLLAVMIAVACSILGYLAARHWDTNTAGMIGLATGVAYGLAAVGSPRYGLLSRLVQRISSALRITCEDLLSLLYRLEELAAGRRLAPHEVRQAIGGGLSSFCALAWLRWQSQVRRTPLGIELTDEGRHRAVALVRAHRLWESFLVTHLGLPADHVHDPAERMEHFLDTRLQDQIAADLEQVDSDPHGREIPDRTSRG